MKSDDPRARKVARAPSRLVVLARIAATPKATATFESLALSSDGAIVALGQSNSRVRVIEVATGKALASVATTGPVKWSRVTALALAGSGGSALAVAHGVLHRLDVRSRDIVRVALLHDAYTPIAVAQDVDWCVVGGPQVTLGPILDAPIYATGLVPTDRCFYDRVAIAPDGIHVASIRRTLRGDLALVIGRARALEPLLVRALQPEPPQSALDHWRWCIGFVGTRVGLVRVFPRTRSAPAVDDLAWVGLTGQIELAAWPSGFAAKAVAFAHDRAIGLDPKGRVAFVRPDGESQVAPGAGILQGSLIAVSTDARIIATASGGGVEITRW